MLRLLPALLAVLLAADAASAANPLAGRWKFFITEGTQTLTFLFAFSEANGKWTGDFIGSSAQLQREPKFESVHVTGDDVKFTLTFAGREFISFDGLLAKDGKKITGSYSQFGSPLKLTAMYPSQLKRLDDPVALARENFSQLSTGPELFAAGFIVLNQASAKKVPVEDVRSVADKLAKSASQYGPRWERAVALKMASALADQPGYTDVAIAQARRAERMLTDATPTTVQLEVVDTLARVLTRAGKPDEAKKYIAQARKLETQDYAEFVKTKLAFASEAYKGRKAKSDRTALYEVFTGSECPPCAAVALACDGLEKSFKSSELIVLEYHIHVPAPDPLTSPDSMDRVGYYADIIKGAPTVLLDGKPVGRGGGPASLAKEKYTELRDAAEKVLETTTPIKLALAVTPGAKGFTAKATVTDAEQPGAKLMLRFALVEPRVRFAGGNGIRYHTQVVRAMPGGAKGFPLTKKSQEQTVTIDPAEVRTKLEKYLTDYAKTESEFPHPQRPLELNNLKLVAFVQNDATQEILQAVLVDLKK
jgi:thiol-disulfide isomerase/thioredoxin